MLQPSHNLGGGLSEIDCISLKGYCHRIRTSALVLFTLCVCGTQTHALMIANGGLRGLGWNRNVDGVRKGSGRPRLYTQTRTEREIRVAVPHNLHTLWSQYKRLSGCRTDGEFMKYLLHLVEKDM